MPPGVETRRDLVFSVNQERVGDAELLTECTDGRGGLSDADPYDGKALGTELPVERLLGG